MQYEILVLGQENACKRSTDKRIRFFIQILQILSGYFVLHFMCQNAEFVPY